MKINLLLFVVGVMLQTTSACAQPSQTNDQEVSPTSQVVLTDNSTVSGVAKDNIRKKGELILVTGGKKIKYKAVDISSAIAGSTRYITSNYTFYEVLFEGKQFSLLRKANEPEGIQYNGSDPVAISSIGDIDDLFVKKTDGTLQLLTKKNFKEVLGQTCPSTAASVDVSKFEMAAIKKAVKDCDKEN